jgi:hypothetical protein
MATFTINTRNHGLIDFTCSDEGGYVRANGKQIGSGGYMGSMLEANEKTLERVARKWHRAQLSAIARYDGLAY